MVIGQMVCQSLQIGGFLFPNRVVISFGGFVISVSRLQIRLRENIIAALHVFKGICRSFFIATGHKVTLTARPFSTSTPKGAGSRFKEVPVRQ